VRILLDTHAYFWWETDHPKLSRRARELITAAETEVLVSAVVAWELATKAHLGKWPGAAEVVADVERALVEEAFAPLPIRLPHARAAGLLPSAHRDPFDRMLAAQAQIENVPLVSADPAFRGFAIEVLW
jgi:PIN domain nuclease of toxin-antitoxin system